MNKNYMNTVGLSLSRLKNWAETLILTKEIEDLLQICTNLVALKQNSPPEIFLSYRHNSISVS
jgi:hypothetical protein